MKKLGWVFLALPLVAAEPLFVPFKIGGKLDIAAGRTDIVASGWMRVRGAFWYRNIRIKALEGK